MADNSSLKSNLEDDPKDGGLKPETAPDPVHEVAKDERSLDIGESGQFAPGGYYNQQAVVSADRIDLDEGMPKNSSEDK